MFPNVRLMIAAMLASTVAIGCGLGLFAAFRVNSGPFARSSDSGPPLQLVVAHAMPAPDAAAAPFGVRFPIEEPRAGGAETAKAAAAPVQATVADSKTAPDSAASSDAKASVTTTAATTADSKVKTTPKAARRHRVVRRVREPQAGADAPATDRNFTSAEPSFQLTPTAQASHRARRKTAVARPAPRQAAIGATSQ